MSAPTPYFEQSPEFRRALAFTLSPKIEGGWVHDSLDPGGETNFGISKLSYPDEDIAAMTRERAAYLYRRDYWLPNRCGDMPFLVGLPLFDFAVNAPAKAARMCLQKVVGAEPDGILGPESMDALVRTVDERGARWVGLKLIDLRLVRYIRRVQANLSSKRFLLGWTRRLHYLIVELYEGDDSGSV